jgi:hypothetical protein
MALQWGTPEEFERAAEAQAKHSRWGRSRSWPPRASVSCERARRVGEWARKLTGRDWPDGSLVRYEGTETAGQSTGGRIVISDL